MSKQLNLFGEKVYVATKSYIVYKSPFLGYESFVIRYCLRASRNGDQFPKKELLLKVQSTEKPKVLLWFSKNKEKLEFF